MFYPRFVRKQTSRNWWYKQKLSFLILELLPFHILLWAFLLVFWGFVGKFWPSDDVFSSFWQDGCKRSCGIGHWASPVDVLMVFCKYGHNLSIKIQRRPVSESSQTATALALFPHLWMYYLNIFSTPFETLFHQKLCFLSSLIWGTRSLLLNKFLFPLLGSFRVLLNTSYKYSLEKQFSTQMNSFLVHKNNLENPLKSISSAVLKIFECFIFFCTFSSKTHKNFSIFDVSGRAKQIFWLINFGEREPVSLMTSYNVSESLQRWKHRNVTLPLFIFRPSFLWEQNFQFSICLFLKVGAAFCHFIEMLPFGALHISKVRCRRGNQQLHS